MQSINIIGAGLAGSLLSVHLAQRGFKVKVYERRADMRKQLVDRGRSINLAMSARAITALLGAGMFHEILPIVVAMTGREIHGRDGSLHFQPYSYDPIDCIFSISRSELNMRLMNRAEALELVDFQFDTICEEVDLNTGAVILRNMASDTRFQAPGELTIATDGAYSAVRYAMQKMPRFNYAQEHLSHGYKELTIPPGPGGSFQMKKEALHIWPRGEFMMIALPNPDGSFTCTLFFPLEGPNSFETLNTPARVRAFFETEFPDATPLIADLETEFFSHPVGSLVTVRTWPWVLDDKIALLGDSAHAIVPFFGQGMNAAFEDVSVLSSLIDKHGTDWATVLAEFQAARKPNADAIADMALENYLEMRDKTADPAFLFRKAVEHHLEKHLENYKSRYGLVSFTNIPYAEAYRRGQINLEILEELMKGIERPEDVDLELARKLVQERLGDLYEEFPGEEDSEESYA